MGQQKIMTDKSFLFICCQPGAEWTIKQEIARTNPLLKSAFQRPGLITFRSDGKPVTTEVSRVSRFAYLFGKSLGMAKSAEDVLALANDLGPSLRLHVFDRAAGPRRSSSKPETASAHSQSYDESELDNPSPSPATKAVEAEIRALDIGPHRRFLPDVAAEVGDLVLDVIVAEGEPLFVGAHRHQQGLGPFPGGHFGVELPDAAPSRAYLKLEEAVRSFNLPLLAGDMAVDIGAAPGGATYALLRRGINVVAVDPGAMDPMLTRFQGPTGARLIAHLPMTVGSLRWEDLPQQTDWLLCDVHLAPQVALHAMRRILAGLRHSLAGVIFTLKLNQWSFAEHADSWIAGAKKEGLYQVDIRQLPSHRQECCLVGLTAIGNKRRGSSLNHRRNAR